MTKAIKFKVMGGKFAFCKCITMERTEGRGNEENNLLREA